MKLAAARRLALRLPEATVQPHFDMDSWRVNGKIFATVPDGHHLHVFVGDLQVDGAVAMNPDAVEELGWGKRRPGVRVDLDLVTEDEMRELLTGAWRAKAPKRLVKLLDAAGR